MLLLQDIDSRNEYMVRVITKGSMVEDIIASGYRELIEQLTAAQSK